MTANRIIARLEAQIDFNKVQFVYIDGGSWRYPVPIKTISGNLNISALYPSDSKVPMLSDVSGYNFQTATGDNAAFGKEYCETKQPWPNAESVIIRNNLAVVCLKK